MPPALCCPRAAPLLCPHGDQPFASIRTTCTGLSIPGALGLILTLTWGCWLPQFGQQRSEGDKDPLPCSPSVPHLPPRRDAMSPACGDKGVSQQHWLGEEMVASPAEAFSKIAKKKKTNRKIIYGKRLLLIIGMCKYQFK